MEKIAVHINSAEESKLVQEECFRRGMVWLSSNTKTYNPSIFSSGNKDCYFAECHTGGKLGACGSKYWMEGGYTLIEAAEFLNTEKPKTPEIKPCYCGKIPVSAPTSINRAKAWGIKCTCGCGSVHLNKERCIEEWNRFVLDHDTVHCINCGAYLLVEQHSSKCPNRIMPYTGPSVFEIQKSADRRKFYDDLISHGRDIPKRILGPGAKRLKSSEEVEGD